MPLYKNSEVRYQIGPWRASNLPVGAATTNGARATGLVPAWGARRPGLLIGWVLQDTGSVAVAGADIDMQVTTDNAGTWTSFGTFPIGTSGQLNGPANNVLAVAAGNGVVTAVLVRFVTPAGYTSVGLDPQVELVFKES